MNQPALGSNPAGLLGRRAVDEDLLLFRDTPKSGRFVRRRKLRISAHATIPKGVANSKLRRLLAHNTSFNCADVKVGDAVLLHKAPNRDGAPRRRGPSEILDIDETGATVKFQSQTYKVARKCVRKKAGAQDVGEADWNPSPGNSDAPAGIPSVASGKT